MPKNNLSTVSLSLEAPLGWCLTTGTAWIFGLLEYPSVGDLTGMSNIYHTRPFILDGDNLARSMAVIVQLMTFWVR